MAGVGNIGQLDGGAPFFGIGGERNYVCGTAGGRAGPHAAGVADNHKTEGCVAGVVGFNQLKQLAVDSLWRDGERDVESGGVAGDAGPVAVEGEEDAIGDADGGEDAPAGEEADLAGRKAGFGGFANAVIVKYETVQHEDYFSASCFQPSWERD